MVEVDSFYDPISVTLTTVRIQPGTQSEHHCEGMVCDSTRVHKGAGGLHMEEQITPHGDADYSVGVSL